MTKQILNSIFEEATTIINKTGIKSNFRDYDIKIGLLRSTMTLGDCTMYQYHDNSNTTNFRIRLNSKLLEASARQTAINTMIHEILHVIAMSFGCMGHTGLWKKFAEQITRKTKYNIARCIEPIDVDIDIEPKYILKCVNKDCGAKVHRNKFSKVIKNYKKYQCGYCSSDYKRVK